MNVLGSISFVATNKFLLVLDNIFTAKSNNLKMLLSIELDPADVFPGVLEEKRYVDTKRTRQPFLCTCFVVLDRTNDTSDFFSR